MPRLVRRRPFMERITSALNPWDFFLWVSEEIETRDIGSKSLGTQLGLALNFIFLLARANGAYSTGSADDVFNDNDGVSWLAYFAWSFAWALAGFSVWNLYYTFWRTRAYRFFEQDVEKPVGTPNAQRVRVQSSPASSSPLRILGDIVSTESAESRAHPDKTRDVWELRLWDPLPASLQLLCLFSPVHVLMYMLALPIAPMDARPSVTVFKCLVEQAALSIMLLTLESKFAQQNKDSAHVQREVMREYDIKYVHPRLYPLVRDVGTQCGDDGEGLDHEFVELGTPSTLIKRPFKTNPNPNYLSHIDPDSNGRSVLTSRSRSPSVTATPINRPLQSDLFPSIKARPSPLRHSMPASGTRNVSPEKSMVNASTGTGTSYGGSLGVFTHSKSPLKKAASSSDMRGDTISSPRNSRELAAIEQRDLAERMMRKSSPIKDNRRSGLSSNIPQLDSPAAAEPASSPNFFSNMGKHRSRYERFPSRF
ncbi:hypothetical protein N0V93_007259 [Gnomoniopsis smithogilvyi]|uniref:Meiotically up-regulated gene 154 protein n=1 Tax=Gnomoniopsis smithogilvyi TaxID=1191159 RepID=A0A9W8YPQ9_9PEZI|nr:hypothetical protein N0V93_007259 [Gnomoniopsis smithogilvyi]